MNGLKEALNKSILDLSERVNRKCDFRFSSTNQALRRLLRGHAIPGLRKFWLNPSFLKSRPVSTRKKASETVQTLLLLFALLLVMPAFSSRAATQRFELIDGSVLYVKDNGAMRMEDKDGKPLEMKDDVVMETVDGKLFLMQNQHLWKRHRHKLTAGTRQPPDAEPEEVIRLKDGSILAIDDRGDMRMLDLNGRPMKMTDGVIMETEDGQIILMRNRRLWRPFGD